MARSKSVAPKLRRAMDKATAKFEQQRERNMDIKNELAFLRRQLRRLTLAMFRLKVQVGGKRG